MRLLVVEDDQRLGNIIVKTLKEESYAVDWASDGQEGEWLAFENPYDLILLDLMLPRKDGFSVLQSLRDNGVKSPVLVLSARDQTPDKVKGLDDGADDYLTKPFNLDELLARVRALLRRHPTEETSSVLKIGPLTINTAAKSVTRDDKKIDLTAKEFALLEYMAKYSNIVLSRAQLSDHVWDMNFDPSSNVVDVYIGYLRNKIDKGFSFPLIQTVRGHGYMLVDSQQENSSEGLTVEASP